MKTKDTAIIVSIVAVAFVAVIWLIMGSNLSTTDNKIVDDQGNVLGPWANKVVKYELKTTDEFTGANVAATAKVYDEQPADWENPRGKFDDAKDYTSYTASSGTVTIDEETPGDYYVVLTASGYNTEFLMISIPDGSGRADILSDYNANPDIEVANLAAVGTTTDKDFAFTLVNDTSAELSDTVLETVADNTEFRGWKVIVNDEEGFSLDTDGDGTYDEGITRYLVSVGGIEYTVFEPSRGVDEFDSNDEFTFLLDNVEIADGDKLDISVEIDAATGDYTGANDEVWGEGEGVLSYIKVYDQQGNLFSTTDVTA